VVLTKHPKVRVGERLYGYFPMSKFTVLTPSTIQPTGFYVTRDHLPVDRKVYNQYYFVRSDPFYIDPKLEDYMMIFRPLFFTSFFLDDFLVENKYFGAKEIIVSSSSSKTAFSLAFLLHHKQNVKVIGLTSQRNINYVKNLKCYDDIISYENVSSLPKNQTVAYIDVAGDAKILTKVHNHFQDNLKISLSVGMSHWEQIREKPPANINLQTFFAPVWIKKRHEELGGEIMGEKMVAAWKQCMVHVHNWVKVVSCGGLEEVENVYKKVLKGNAGPDEGYVVSFWTKEQKSKL